MRCLPTSCLLATVASSCTVASGKSSKTSARGNHDKFKEGCECSSPFLFFEDTFLPWHLYICGLCHTEKRMTPKLVKLLLRQWCNCNCIVSAGWTTKFWLQALLTAKIVKTSEFPVNFKIRSSKKVFIATCWAPSNVWRSSHWPTCTSRITWPKWCERSFPPGHVDFQWTWNLKKWFQDPSTPWPGTTGCRKTWTGGVGTEYVDKQMSNCLSVRLKRMSRWSDSRRMQDTNTRWASGLDR